MDLTEAYDQLAALIPGKQTEAAGTVPEIRKEQRTLGFNPVTTAAAEGLLMDAGELQKIADLLRERKQLIFYGPPGTGKTYLAKALARHLTEDGAVRLIQFHPSYTYEDFFEGFRPKSADGGTGALTFELTPGPFRLFAEAAKANPTTAYILIIDEINRANLAKVFGELYFLLEYRDEAISPAVLPEGGVHTPGEPVRHRHDEHCGPVHLTDRHVRCGAGSRSSSWILVSRPFRGYFPGGSRPGRYPMKARCSSTRSMPGSARRTRTRRSARRT